MMPRVYIGRRGEAGKSEDVKKKGNESGIRFLFYFFSPLTSLQLAYIPPTRALCLAIGSFVLRPSHKIA